MMHPIREFHEDPLQAGVFYGAITEAGAALSIVPGSFVEMPPYLLALAATLAILGVAIILGSMFFHGRRP